MNSSSEFKLRAVLQGHSMDVRCVTTTPNGDIVTGSRDMTAKLWRESDTPAGFSEAITFRGHTKYVGSIAYLPEDKPGSGRPLVLTGCYDGKIRCFHLDSPDPVCVLDGHSSSVSTLSSGAGIVVSGSWDHSARIWVAVEGSIMGPNEAFRCKAVLEGHEAAVWASAIVSRQSLILTGGADKCIIIWDLFGKQIRKMQRHQDVVRGLAVLPDETGFLSCSNDATVQRWVLPDGDRIAEYTGHTNFVYSISILPLHKDGLCAASCGEDGTLRLWDVAAGQEIQKIDLPLSSAWQCVGLPNGDVAVGGSDGVCRVFTPSGSGREAPAEVQSAFQIEVEERLKAKAGKVGNVKISDLPGPEKLLVPGKKEGQNLMIREGAKAVLYVWSGTGRWEKVGDVVGAIDEGTEGEPKTTFEGKAYDFVFTVDIEEGRPPLKLPYNMTEDPWKAAQAFIHRTGVSQIHLDTIAKFIMDNTKHRKPQYLQEQGAACDPLTGGSRYIPGAGTPGAELGGVAHDPLTAPSRYVPGSAPDVPRVTNGSLRSDPLTMPSRYVPDSETEAGLIPVRQFVSLDACNVPGLRGKLHEFREMYSPELISEQSLNSLVDLAQGGSAANDQEAEALMELIFAMVKWPRTAWVPVLDLLRLLFRHNVASNFYFSSKHGQSVMSLLYEAAADENGNIRMLALRCFCNAMVQSAGMEEIQKMKTTVIALIFDLVTTTGKLETKPAEVAAATLLLNLTISVGRFKEEEHSPSLLAACVSSVEKLKVEEALWRALLALGTLLVSFPDLKNNLKGGVIALPTDSGKHGWKVAEAAKQVQQLLEA